MWIMLGSMELVQQLQSGALVSGGDVDPGLAWLRRRAPFSAGDMVTVAGRTSAGKSHLTLAMLSSMVDAGERALYVSLEDSPRRVARRLANGYAREGLSVAFERGESGAVATLCLEAGRAGARVCAVDYVQLMSYTGSVQLWSQTQVLARVVADLKAAARDAGVVLVLVSQCRRPERGAEADMPTLYDLAESAALERASEVVLMIADLNGTPTVELAKSKDGPRGARFRMQRDPTTGVLSEPPVQAAGEGTDDDGW